MHMRPVTQGDLPAFATVVGLSMWDDEVMRYTAPYKDSHPDSYLRHCLHRARVRWFRGELLFLCVSDESDLDWTGEEVNIGYCCYSTTMKGYEKPVRGGWLGGAFEKYSEDWWAGYARLFRLNRSSDPAGEDHFRKVLAEGHAAFDPYFAFLPATHRDKHEKQHWELELLGTHPDYRRRGVGKFMLQWGFDQATRDGVPLVLLASITGEKLYLKTGFKEVARISMLPKDRFADKQLQELDLGLGKGKGLSWAAMVWEPSELKSQRDE